MTADWDHPVRVALQRIALSRSRADLGAAQRAWCLHNIPAFAANQYEIAKWRALHLAHRAAREVH